MIRRHPIRALKGVMVLALMLSALVTGRAHGASLFAMNLLGERLESGDVRSIGLGGSTQMLADSLGVLQWNPALLGRINRVTVGASQYLSVDQGSNELLTERNISFTFSQFKAAFPIGRLAVLSIGYVGRYEPGGGFSVGGVTESGDTYTQSFVKSGGLFSVPLGLSFKLTRFFTIGGTVSFEGGFVEDRINTVFDGPGFAPTSGFKKEEFTGNTWSAGIVFWPTPRTMIGGSFQNQIDYDTDIFERFTDSDQDTVYQSTAKLPSMIQGGVTFQAFDNLMLAGSFSVSDFSKFEGVTFPTERLGWEQSLSAGIELPKGIGGIRAPLRFGFNYQKLPYGTPLVAGGEFTGERVEKLLGTFGTAASLGHFGKLDIAFQAGTIGTNLNNVKDRVFRFYFSVVGSEVWRRRAGRPQF